MSRDYNDDEYEAPDIESDTSEIVFEKPSPLEVEIAGKTYTLFWSKDYFWMNFFNASNGGNGPEIYRAMMELLHVSLDAADSRRLEARIRDMSDEIDASDLMSAVFEMAAQWEELVLPRMENMGVSIPEKFKKRMNRANRRAVSKNKRVVKSPSSAKKR